ncbi:hypothetical protein [Parasedimentitalea psychrophila]|uniref:Uncharacterized protein n=1 Tax=Parasedimentitalea psychrophila TaxID=2997337 RepID=A0A9Y2KWT2_9RHOB|nr:hypothetical protein [Parasedimentitalea psychrophila]WIY23993.1 hypothetical protein QPJ95_15370 [Parasedimentitalea psychrophila]
MILQFPSNRLLRVAAVQRTGKAMKVFLHIGAHRCATTSFQDYLRRNSDALDARNIGYWGPGRTRNGLFNGILPGPIAATGRNPQRRAVGRVQMQLSRSQSLGLDQLLVSDENMMGTMRQNLRTGGLYGGVGERMARFAEAFDGYVSDVMVNLRSLESYWASAFGYGVARGHRIPSAAMLDHLAYSRRSWRDVLTDVACAVPGARIWALPFETYGGRPEAQLAAITGQQMPRNPVRNCLNATPRLEDLRRQLHSAVADRLPAGQGRWQPFDTAQIAALRETYADDLMWLAAGGDGLVQLKQDPEKAGQGMNPARTDLTRGTPHDDQTERVAGAG